jgi:predicted nucleic acid-binding protein
MIIDASVALKWVFLQPDSPAASALLSRTDLSAPSNALLECAHALTRAVRGRQMTPEQARLGFASIASAIGHVVGFETLLERALELSLSLNAVVHDCLYLALAIDEDEVVITADMRFVRAVRAHVDYSMRVRALSEL